MTTALENLAHELFEWAYKGNLFFNQRYSDPRLLFVMTYGGGLNLKTGKKDPRWGELGRGLPGQARYWDYQFEYGYTPRQWLDEEFAMVMNPIRFVGNRDAAMDDLVHAKLVL